MIKLDHYHGKDRVCNYCNRFRRSEPSPDVDFYALFNDSKATSAVIMILCEYCADRLFEQLADKLDMAVT